MWDLYNKSAIYISKQIGYFPTCFCNAYWHVLEYYRVKYSRQKLFLLIYVMLTNIILTNIMLTNIILLTGNHMVRSYLQICRNNVFSWIIEVVNFHCICSIIMCSKKVLVKISRIPNELKISSHWVCFGMEDVLNTNNLLQLAYARADRFGNDFCMPVFRFDDFSPSQDLISYVGIRCGLVVYYFSYE